MITLEQIESKHTELADLIAKFKTQTPRLLNVPGITIELAAGEQYGGSVLNDDGTVKHHIVLLPETGKDLEWEEAKAWAAEQGGMLTTRLEQSLLFANLKPHFEAAAYWSADESSASYAWCQYFHDGRQGTSHKNYELCARAVRRLIA